MEVAWRHGSAGVGGSRSQGGGPRGHGTRGCHAGAESSLLAGARCLLVPALWRGLHPVDGPAVYGNAA